ncbi:MAG: right-handed parallel beta-helix repeat-containing protein [Bacteroidales bacterium]|jgi:uncharacterized protein (TIGR02145 family)|nr:right-handed parallel beta-helix repeat-containing protein [Bacteroidales bacterium]
MCRNTISLPAALIAAALFASCAKEVSLPEEGGAVSKATASLQAIIPTERIATRASHNGGATNADTSQYDLRYIVEAWTQDSSPQLAARYYRIVPRDFTMQGITLDVSLPKAKYDLTFWADFVPEGTTEDTAHDADLYYVTNNGSSDAAIIADPTVDPGLQAVKMKKPADEYDICDDARDAFCTKVEIDLTGGNVSKSVTLYRPLGKYRLIALDNPGYLNSISEMTLTYDSPTVDIPAGYNVLTATGTADRLTLPVKTYQHAVTVEDVLVKGVTYQNATVVAFDYLFAPSGQTVNMTVNALNSSGATVGDPRTLTNIPIAQNRLTTVIGHYFLPNAHLSIIVSDPFEDETEVDYTGKTVDEVININHLTEYATVHDALAAAVPGDSIFVPEGSFEVPEQETVPANIVLKGNGRTGVNRTVLCAAGGFVLGGVIQDVMIYKDVNVKDNGTPWPYRTTGVEMLENSTLKNCLIHAYFTGILAEKTSGLTIDNTEINGCYYGAKFTGGVAATLNDFNAEYNEVYGIGLFQGPDAIAANKPTFTGFLRLYGNWVAQFVNAWDDAYYVRPDNLSDIYDYTTATVEHKVVYSDAVFERDPDIDMSERYMNNMCDSIFIADFVVNNRSNILTDGYTNGSQCIYAKGMDIDGTVWDVRNAHDDDGGHPAIDYYEIGPRYAWQWNKVSALYSWQTQSWDDTWVGGYGAPSTSDTWTQYLPASPCPTGWRLPTKAEVRHLFAMATGTVETLHDTDFGAPDSGLSAECYKWVYGDRLLCFNKEQYIDENGTLQTGDGFYWTKESGETDPTKAAAYSNMVVDKPRASGFMVRCVHPKLKPDGTWDE